MGSIASRAALNQLPVNIAVLDRGGNITSVNDSWIAFGAKNGLAMPNHGVGANYLDYCTADGPGAAYEQELRAVLGGRSNLLNWVYPCHGPDQKRWFSVVGVPAAPSGALLLHFNITDFLPGGVDQTLRVNISEIGALANVSEIVERAVARAMAPLALAAQGGDGRTMAGSNGHDRCVSAVDALTNRQREVLALLGDGKSNDEIARLLSSAPNTIKRHVSAILRRLGMRSRLEAAVFAAKLGK
jgi:DNA-binding CsgD family transcriptional regulator